MTDTTDKIQEEITEIFLKKKFILKHSFYDNGTTINHYQNDRDIKIINTFQVLDDSE